MPAVLVQPLWLGFAAIIDILTFGSVNVSQVTNLSSLKETVPSVLFSLLNLSTVVLERQMFGMEMEWKIAPEAKDLTQRC